MSISGGAEAGKSAMSFNWVTDPAVTNSEIIYGTSPNLDDGVKKAPQRLLQLSQIFFQRIGGLTLKLSIPLML